MKLEKLNTKTLQKTLNDDYEKKVVIGYEPIKREQIIREEGETWTDEKGNKWKREDGKNINISLQESIEEQKRFFSCKGCGKYMLLETNRKDIKFFMKTGKCMDCNVEEDNARMINGTYKEYEQEKIKQNKISWLKDLRKEINIVAENYNNQQYMNEITPGNVEIEKWNIDIESNQLKELLLKMYDNTVAVLGIDPKDLE